MQFMHIYVHVYWQIVYFTLQDILKKREIIQYHKFKTQSQTLLSELLMSLGKH